MNHFLEDVAATGVPGIITAIGGAGGIAAFIKAWADRRRIIADTGKVGVEAAAIISNTAIALVNSVGTQSAKLETQIADLETRLKAAETRAEAAETRLRQCGKT